MSVMDQNCDRCQMKQGGYRICGVQCKMKMQFPLQKILKQLQIAKAKCV